MSREVILTGLRTNSDYHLGNYIGAVLPMVKAVQTKAKDYQINLFIPDLHSFTTPIDHQNFYQQTWRNLKLLVAAGMPLDDRHVYLYRQSQLPAHAEAAWIFANFTGFGEMRRMVEFKDKRARLGVDRVSVGLFTYPILMAADILLHDARWVPVGDDQRQHLEFCRRLAQRFNQRFGQLLVVPETMSTQQKFIGRLEPPRILNLKTPTQKMSKSINEPAGTIMLLDEPSQAAAKIMSATTDSLGQINYDWTNQAGITNLLVILATTSGQDQASVNQAWQFQTDYQALKQATAEAVANFLSQLQTKLEQVDEAQLAGHLAKTERLLNRRLKLKMAKIQAAIGLKEA